MRLVIDSNFIAGWSPRYDESEHDEEEYQKIIEILRAEFSSAREISETTTKRILKWKNGRGATKIILENFDKFPGQVKKSMEAQETEKLKTLDDFPGIGVPMGSTILHFIYPDKFPIMDIRTTEVLHRAGLTESKQRNYKNYWPFREVILQIQKETGYSLRDIDRALFAYHKCPK